MEKRYFRSQNSCFCAGTYETIIEYLPHGKSQRDVSVNE